MNFSPRKDRQSLPYYTLSGVAVNVGFWCAKHHGPTLAGVAKNRTRREGL
jgi:hypothetical protein